LITQPVFIAKTCAWVRWKGYLLSKIKKIKKPTTTIFFKFFFGFDDLKWNYFRGARSPPQKIGILAVHEGYLTTASLKSLIEDLMYDARDRKMNDNTLQERMQLRL
jgi:hypothetical protein